MIRPLSIVAIQLVLLLYPFVSAQTQPNSLQFEHITTLNGLSQDIVTSLHRDQFGFLWIGTEDGLNRYDGYTIKIYKHIPNDTLSLSNNWVTGICDFGDEDLLIRTTNGNSIYKRASDAFTKLGGVLSSFSNVPFNAAARDSFGNYWMIESYGKIVICSPDLQRYSTFQPQAYASNIFVDSRKRVLVSTDSALLVFDHNSSTPKSLFLRDASRPSSPLISIGVIAEDKIGTLWFGTPSGLYRYHESTDSLEFVPLYDNPSAHQPVRDYIMDMKFDHAGRLWVGGFNGFYCYNPLKKQSMRYFNMQNNPVPGISSRVYAVYVDPAEILWAGTWREGLFKTNLHTEQFGTLRHSTTMPFAGGRSSITAIYQDIRGRIWLGESNYGVTLFNDITRTTQPLPLSQLSGGTISAITGDNSGNVWVASTNNIIDWFDVDLTRVRRLRLPSSHDDKIVLAMHVDSSGILWIGTSRGVYRFDPVTKEFHRVEGEKYDSLSNPLASAWSFFSDHSNNVWVGGWMASLSLYKFSLVTGEIRSYTEREVNAARSIIEDEDNTLWIATWGNGLTKFNPESGTIDNYTEANGLPSNYLKGILSDGQGLLWISSEKGLSTFNPRTGKFRNYDITDGLQGNFFYSGSCLKSMDGKFYFGGTGGVNAFYPDSIRDVNYVAPVVITGFRVFDDQKFFERSLSQLPAITLSYEDNLFAFEYVSLDYRSPARQQYAYMMEGFNDEWIQAGTRRYVTFTHLDPGDYTFKVKGTNSDGIWNSTPASIRVIISPAFWQTWWFRSAVVFIVASLLYALYRYRVQKLLEVEKTRAAIATDLHDDIGTSLTNIALFSDLAQRDVALGSSEVTYRLEKISQTSRSLLDSMNDIVWSIKPENDALEQTILRMEDYAVEMLEENGIDLHVQIPNHLKMLKLPMAVRRNLFLIFKEAIGNVLKHAKATRVDVSIASIESGKRLQGLQVLISDNGKGFIPSTHKSGNGLHNMELRARHLNGTLVVTSDGKQGTKVEIQFPIKSHK